MLERNLIIILTDDYIYWIETLYLYPRMLTYTGKKTYTYINGCLCMLERNLILISTYAYACWRGTLYSGYNKRVLIHVGEEPYNNING